MSQTAKTQWKTILPQSHQERKELIGKTRVARLVKIIDLLVFESNP